MQPSCVFAYWKRASIHSWLLLKDHWKAYGLTCLTLILGDYFLLKEYGRTAASQMEAQTILSEIIPHFGILMVLFVVVLVAIVPCHLDRMAMEKADGLRSERDQLQERFRPKLAIFYRGGDRFYQKEDRYITRVFLEVANIGASTIDDIEISCDDVLVVAHDAEEIPLILDPREKRFSLHGYQNTFIYVLSHQLDDSKNQGSIHMAARTPFRSIGPVRASGFTFTMTARGRESGMASVQLTCFVKDYKLHVSSVKL